MTREDLLRLADNVVGRLADAGVVALHVGALAFPGYEPPGGEDDYAFDDLQLIVREADLKKADGAMTVLPARPPAAPHPCTRVTWERMKPVAGGGVAPASPGTPGLGYSDLREEYDKPVWVQIYTSWRHGPLLLVNLSEREDDWFGPDRRVGIERMDGHFRPSDEDLLLWQASMVTNTGSDWPGPDKVEREVLKLRAIAARGLNWRNVVDKAIAYDGGYLAAIECNRARIEAYAAARKVAAGRLIATPEANVAGADLDYGVLYDLRHALEALEARYRGTLPPVTRGLNVLEDVQAGTGVRRRKIWDDTCRLGFAPCSIYEQATTPEWAGLPAQDLFNHPGVEAEITGAPRHGYW